MALERDQQAERLARLDVLLFEAKRTVVRIPPTDRDARDSISNHLDELNRLRGRSVSSSGDARDRATLFTNAGGKHCA
jgi:hypothetical protein